MRRARRRSGDRLTTLERWAIGTLLLATTCSCAVPRVVPMVPRPDTRMIYAIHVDSLAVESTMAILRAALPSEGAICYRGAIVDTAFVRQDSSRVQAKMLILTAATKALQDSADLFHVYGVHCDGTEIAIAHSHPYSPNCDQSVDDAIVLFDDSRALASIVWCGNGETEVLYQDGRRTTSRWRA